MDEDPQPKQDLIAEGTDDRAVARRRFIKVGLGVATPVILTIKSRPAWGACGGDLVYRVISASGATSCRPE